MVDFVVDALSDVVYATDGLTSLREAIASANTQARADTIVFQAGLTGLLRLTQGELQITDPDLVIDGDGRITITGDADNDHMFLSGTDLTDVGASGANLLDDNSRIFNISGANTAIMFPRLTLTGGRTAGAADRGGAIYRDGVGDLQLVLFWQLNDECRRRRGRPVRTQHRGWETAPLCGGSMTPITTS